MDTFKHVDSLFPVIDDPANMFYSRVRNIISSLNTTHLHVKALNRTDRLITLIFPFSTRLWKIKVDRRNIDSEVVDCLSSGNVCNGYAVICFLKAHKRTSETTSTGEIIPVDTYSLHFRGVSKELSYFQTKEKLIVADEGDDFLNLGIRISESMRIEHHLPDFEYLDNTAYKQTYKSTYRPIIGRKVVFTQTSSTVISWMWDLYDIDSDYNEILIDSSVEDYPSLRPLNFVHSYSSCGFSNIWPICYGPAIDHPVSLTFCKSKSDTSPYPTGTSTVTVKVMEKEFASDEDPVDISMYKGTDYFLNNRGLVEPQYLQSFIQGFRIGYHKNTIQESDLREYYQEEILLALCFIFNINFRHLYGASFNRQMYENTQYYRSGDHLSILPIPTIQVDDARANVTIPDEFTKTYGQTPPISDIRNMYYLDAFNDSSVVWNTSVLNTPTAVPLIQNSFGGNLNLSPFDKFRASNLQYLLALRNAFLSSKIRTNKDTSASQSLIKYVTRLNYLTDTCSGTNIFMIGQ